MENFPLFGSFKKFGMTQKEQIQNAWKNKEWGWLLLFTIVVLLVLIPATGYFWGGIDSLVSQVNKYIPNNASQYPPKTLTYKRLEQKRDEDGLYRTLFEITIIYPAGNANPSAFIPITGIYPDAECQKGSEQLNVEPYLGVATTTRKFLLSCITKERILDNGHLFGNIIE